MAISNTNRTDLSNVAVNIEDSAFLSQYFNVTEFNSTLGSGKNLLIVNPTGLLSPNPNIQIQALDGAGKKLFIDSAVINDAASGRQTYYYSIFVNSSSTSGTGKVTIIGTTAKNELVRWSSNIVINPLTETKSRIIFKNKPQLVIYPIITNTLSNFVDINPKTISGSFTSLAVSPPKDFNITNEYDKNLLDYRLIDTSASFSNALVNFPIILNVSAIKKENASTTQFVTASNSFLVKNVINDHMLQLADPYVFANNKISEIVSATYTCSYNNVNYNSSSFFTSSYATQSTDFSGNYRYVKNSYALIGYKNLETFSGDVKKHKIYKKDLSSAGGYILVADEIFEDSEMLVDITTPNKTFENLGTFYSQFHINNFWFTSSNDVSLKYDNSTFLNSMIITASNDITGGYIIAKPNSSFTQRNAQYLPFDAAQNLVFTGSAFDSNYLRFYPNTSYNISFNAAFLDKSVNASASLDFYITSSATTVINEPNYILNKGIKVGSISLSGLSTSKIFDTLQSFDFSFLNETCGALVIYPKNFKGALLSDISITPTKKFGYSQGTYIAKFPFDVNKPNDIFEIKAELYDKDGTLAYDDLFTIQNFDKDGVTTPISINSIGSTLTVSTISASTLIINGNSHLNGYVDGITALIANQISASLYGTASWAFNAVTASFALSGVSGSGGTGSASLTTGSYYPITASWSNTSSNLFLKNFVLFDFSSSIASLTSTILQVSTGSYNSAFFDYFAASSSNYRAGTLLCAFSGSNVSYTEFSSNDIGNTNPVTMSVVLTSGSIKLNSTIPSGQIWLIKATGRYL
jgi:hypothetical protein